MHKHLPVVNGLNQLKGQRTLEQMWPNTIDLWFEYKPKNLTPFIIKIELTR